MASRITVLALAAGLGLAGGAVLLETLPTASSGPSGRVRAVTAPALGPPPFTESVGLVEVPAGVSPREEECEARLPENADSEPEGPIPSDRVRPTLSGVVLDGEGNPLPGARLVGPPRSRHCYSLPRIEQDVGEDGRFTWTTDWFRSPEGAEFTVSAKGFGSRAFRLSEALAEKAKKEGAFDGIEIRLRREAILEGVVLGPDGAPRERARVVLTPDIVSRFPEGCREDRTDAQGRFRFDALSTDPAWVFAEDSGFLSSDLDYSSDIDYAGLRLREGETTRVELTLLESTEVEVAVRVVGVEPGWRFQLGSAAEMSESALLILPGRTGRVWTWLADAEGVCLSSGWREIPRGGAEQTWEFDFSDRRPWEEPRPGCDPGSPPPPDTGESTPTPPKMVE